jgi:hypothetical protein
MTVSQQQYSFKEPSPGDFIGDGTMSSMDVLLLVLLLRRVPLFNDGKLESNPTDTICSQDTFIS